MELRVTISLEVIAALALRVIPENNAKKVLIRHCGELYN